MHQIEQQLHERNLKTAWALASGWSLDHQERLAELVVAEFLAKPVATEREAA